ncbi:PLP-dependent transferase [Nemania sp. NC0429]|nr:PLP-dependent transferase [Nemania sp. NC0429]
MKHTNRSEVKGSKNRGTLEGLPAYSRSSTTMMVTNDMTRANVPCLEISDVVTQSSDSDAESSHEIHTPASTVENDIIQEAFESSKPRWIDDPVISQWRHPGHKVHSVLSEVYDLYREWNAVQSAPFALAPDPLWLDTGRALASVGLPWHNNEVHLPGDIDTSWPFHFKEFEAQVIREKGTRVGDSNSLGYVTSYDEANLYCIRALQQELRKEFPTQRPLLVYDHFDPELVGSAGRLFGIESHRVILPGTLEVLRHELRGATSNATRPIIFAASLCNSNSEYDDLGVISRLSEEFPLILHVDAFRSFDYITLGPHTGGQRPGERLTLAVRNFGRCLRAEDNSVLASTIVAGGLNHSRHDPAIALKPASLGGKPNRISYVRAFDSTLSGSRDAIAPLWIALYERRLGERGLRDTYQYLLSLRLFIMRILEHHKITATVTPYTTDIVIKSCTEAQRKWLLDLGGAVTSNGDIVLVMNSRFSITSLRSLLRTNPFLRGDNGKYEAAILHEKDFVSLYPIPDDILSTLRTTIQSWQVRTRSTAGYPVHMGSYSALGPMIGLFWNLNIPKCWVESKSREILSSRMESFGLVSPQSREDFKGAFTNGSTMGNRYGIMTALQHFPNAFVYFSAETHYSVVKTAQDCDTLTNRWAKGAPRYSKIRCGSNGSILVEALLEQALADKKRCSDDGVKYDMILLVNIGTTFVGARDDLVEIHRTLAKARIQISYIHVDGALNCGFETCGIKLGPCGAVGDDGTPLVQGVTISHHKALGNIVSGEVLCFSPQDQLPDLCSSLDPRVVFETWLYSRVYDPSDLAQMLDECRENASRLETSLNRIGVVTKRNSQSIITVLERPPSWITEEFSLRPEGDWVHFITMSHISKETVDRFVDQLASIDRQFSYAFSAVAPLLSDRLRRTIKLKRVRCCSALAERVSDITRSIVSLDDVRCRDTGPVLDVRSRLRGAVSTVAVDEDDKIRIVFLASSGRDQSIQAGPLLISNEIAYTKADIVDISKLLLGLLGRYMNADVKLDNSSYETHTF